VKKKDKIACGICGKIYYHEKNGKSYESPGNIEIDIQSYTPHQCPANPILLAKDMYYHDLNDRSFWADTSAAKRVGLNCFNCGNETDNGFLLAEIQRDDKGNHYLNRLLRTGICWDCAKSSMKSPIIRGISFAFLFLFIFGALSIPILTNIKEINGWFIFALFMAIIGIAAATANIIKGIKSTPAFIRNKKSLTPDLYCCNEAARIIFNETSKTPEINRVELNYEVVFDISRPLEESINDKVLLHTMRKRNITRVYITNTKFTSETNITNFAGGQRKTTTTYKHTYTGNNIYYYPIKMLYKEHDSSFPLSDILEHFCHKEKLLHSGTQG